MSFWPYWSYYGTTKENSYSVNTREYSDPHIPTSTDFVSTNGGLDIQESKENTQAASYNVSSSKYANKNQGIYSGKKNNVHKSKHSKEDSQHTQQNVGYKTKQKDVIDDLLERIKIKEDKIEQQEKEITTLKQTNNDVNRWYFMNLDSYAKIKVYNPMSSSEELTREMAKRMENGRHFENSTDRFSCSEISKRLKDLHATDWVHLFKQLEKEMPHIEELARIKFLSTLMKRGYHECISLAEKHVRQFLLLESDDLPSRSELQVLYDQLKNICRKDSVRSKFTKVVLDALFCSEEYKNIFPERKVKNVPVELKAFYENFVDCCWIIAISHPPIKLNFDVVGRLYSECEHEWTEFSTKKTVEDVNKAEGTIVEVVWPYVEVTELKDGSKCLSKGDVIVLKRGIRDDTKGPSFTTETYL